MARETKTGGRDATTAVIPGKYGLSIGNPGRELPRGFEWRLLTDLARLESGHTPSRSRPTYWDGEIPWVGIRDASGNHGLTIYDTQQHITQAGVDNSSTRVLPAGTVCLSRTASVGYVITMGVPMATSQDFVNWVCGPGLDRRYLHYMLMAEQEMIRRAAFGSVHATLYYPDAKALYISVPQLSEQRSIADVLGALDNKIAANTKIATTADELAGALTRHAAIQGDSVRLGDVAYITMGSSPKGENLNEQGNGVPFYQGVRDFGMRFPSRRVSTDTPIRFAEPGDLLISVRAPVGEINVAPERLCIGRGLAAVRAKDSRQATLFHTLRHVPEIWLPYEAEGTVFGSINRDQLHGVIVPAFAADSAGRLEMELDAIERRIATALGEVDVLTATREALLPRLMSGKLRVRDAERIAEDPVNSVEQLPEVRAQTEAPSDGLW